MSKLSKAMQRLDGLREDLAQAECMHYDKKSTKTKVIRSIQREIAQTEADVNALTTTLWRVKDITNQRFDLARHKRVPCNKSRRYATEEAAMNDAIEQSRPRERGFPHYSMVYTIEDTRTHRSVLWSAAWVWDGVLRNYIYRSNTQGTMPHILTNRFRVVPSQFIKGYYSVDDTWNGKTYLLENCTENEANIMVERLEKLFELSESRYKEL